MRLFLLVLCASFLAAADVTITVDGNDIGHATLPDDWHSAVSEHDTVLIPPGRHPHVEVIVTPAGTDLASAEKSLQKLINERVTQFAPSKREDITVAGNPAVRLTGPGTEADDGDPSNAQATVFTLGERTVILLAHAEGDGVAEQQAVLEKLAQSFAAN